MTQVANLLIKFVFRPVTFARLKLALFPMLIGALSLDWLVIVRPIAKEIQVSNGSDDVIIPILLGSVFVGMILLNYFTYKRTMKERKKILTMLTDPSLSDNVKEVLVKLLQ